MEQRAVLAEGISVEEIVYELSSLQEVAISRWARTRGQMVVWDVEHGWEVWWAHQDLNLEPTDYESAALTN